MLGRADIVWQHNDEATCLCDMRAAAKGRRMLCVRIEQGMPHNLGVFLAWLPPSRKPRYSLA
jgi:hypothetical protein